MKDVERIDLESEQIYSWFREIFESTYLWIFLIIEFIILISPFILAIVFHNKMLLWLLPITFIVCCLILIICLKIEDKHYLK